MRGDQATSEFGGQEPGTPLVERVWFNAIWFQSFWFVCVLGQDRFVPLALLLLAVHFWLARPCLPEMRRLLPIALIGICADSLLSLTGVYVFSSSALIPLWLCLLWIGFSAALCRSLSFLLPRPQLAALCGVVALPLNYYAGVRLGAVDYGMPLTNTVTIQAVLWGTLLPVMSLGSRRDETGHAKV